MANTTTPLPPGPYPSQAPIAIGVTILCLSIASAVVVLRTYTRGWILNKMGTDDYFAIASLLLTYGAGIAILSMTQFGLGHHIHHLPDLTYSIPLYLRSFYVSIILYCAALSAVKMTFLFQYYRVFGVFALRRVFIAAILVVGAWGLTQVAVGIFICFPVAGFWDLRVKARCIPNYPQFYANAAGNIATDVAVLVMPFPLLKRLRLPRQQKVLLFGIFGLGFFTVAISVLRLKYLTLSWDFTWQNVETSAWSMAELCSGITCACLPTLRPFLKAHFPTLGTRLTGDDGEELGEVEGGGGGEVVHKRVGSGDSGDMSVVEGGNSSGAAVRGDVERGESSRAAVRTVADAEGSDENREEQLEARMMTVPHVD
ncbi:putative integral membrane protein [Coniochaeta sp. 2T2.1]|nr:putative integral membrane protein [Coniochaeta sp. 2T2.1]